MYRYFRYFSLIIIIISFVIPRYAYAVKPTNDQVKAIFIYKFIKFVIWPQNVRGDTYTIGVLGKGQVSDQLKFIEGWDLEGKKIIIKYFDSVDSVEFCHVLFISPEKSSKIKTVLTKLHYPPILTVGETKEFSNNGGIIEFYSVGNNVRFAINQKKAEESGLVISSLLIDIARPR